VPPFNGGALFFYESDCKNGCCGSEGYFPERIMRFVKILPIFTPYIYFYSIIIRIRQPRAVQNYLVRNVGKLSMKGRMIYEDINCLLLISWYN
jgi:hypothetical protein